jgi:hypothetical protein
MLGVITKYRDPPPAAAKAVFLPHAVHLYVSHVLMVDYGFTKIDMRITGLFFHTSPKRQGGYLLRAFTNLDDEMDPASRELTQALEQGFIRALKEGKFTAWARTTPLYGIWYEIPQYTWVDLWPLELNKGTAKGPEGLILYDMRVGERVSIPNLTPKGRSRSQKPLEWVAGELIRRRHQGTLPTSKKGAAEMLAPLYAAVHPDDKKPVSVKRIKNWLAEKEGLAIWNQE